MAIRKEENKNISFCKYNVLLKFSVLDILTGEELIIDRALFDDSQPESMTYSLIDGRYEYSVAGQLKQSCKVEIQKEHYFPFIKRFSLTVTSIHDSQKIIDLGRIPLLNEQKEDALLILWEQHPADLDLYLKCPNGETIGVMKPNHPEIVTENYFGNMAVDCTTGFVPETITMKHWTDVEAESKIGGHYELFVNWFKD